MAVKPRNCHPTLSVAQNFQAVRPGLVYVGCALPAFPVDTHIFRVTKRLGWVPPNSTYEKAHQILGELISPQRYYPLHINLIRHGREICVAGVPRCEVCPLTDVCEYFCATHLRF